MYTGRVVVRGNAGAIPGVAIRGAEIVVHGNMGSRAGQVMKAGTLACAGNANFMAGYMMYGGRIIILGDSGEKVGEDMTGGHIFVGGKVQDLGSDAEQVDLDSTPSGHLLQRGLAHAAQADASDDGARLRASNDRAGRAR